MQILSRPAAGSTVLMCAEAERRRQQEAAQAAAKQRALEQAEEEERASEEIQRQKQQAQARAAAQAQAQAAADARTQVVAEVKRQEAELDRKIDYEANRCNSAHDAQLDATTKRCRGTKYSGAAMEACLDGAEATADRNKTICDREACKTALQYIELQKSINGDVTNYYTLELNCEADMDPRRYAARVR